MTAVLLRHAVKTTAIAVLVVAALVLFTLGESQALGVLLGGTLAGADFLGLVWVVGKMLDIHTAQRKKAIALVLLFSKLTLTAGVLWLALTRFSTGALGVVIGIGAAILGFTIGMSLGSASKEGQRAIEEEEERIRRETSGKNNGEMR